ncbi:MAG TPA: transcription antitermination factor NusB [Gammaproteobacteria bacterium]|nr:transcription antitermination factor NusB [Gammaproteobacteria bacterium]
MAPRPRSLSRARSAARRLAVQALYQWQIGGEEPGELVAQFSDRPEMDAADRGYFTALVRGCVQGYAGLQDRIAPCLDRPVEQLDPVERAILLVGAFELRDRPDVPYRVAINEAVELAKVFGAQGSHLYVNGVLDRLAGTLRSMEKGRARAH